MDDGATTMRWRLPGERRPGRGMTLVETILGIIVTAAVLGVLVLVSGSLRSDAAEHETKRVLRVLHAALQRYHAANEVWPNGSTSEVLDTLSRDEAAQTILARVQWVREERGLMVYDGYGRPIRFLPAPADGTRSADFVSAGPDGDFGDDQNAVAALDNLYGIELSNQALD